MSQEVGNRANYLRGMAPKIERKIPEKARKGRKSFTRVILGGCPRMAILPPANSGTSPMSGIYASFDRLKL